MSMPLDNKTRLKTIDQLFSLSENVRSILINTTSVKERVTINRMLSQTSISLSESILICNHKKLEIQLWMRHLHSWHMVFMDTCGILEIPHVIAITVSIFISLNTHHQKCILSGLKFRHLLWPGCMKSTKSTDICWHVSGLQQWSSWVLLDSTQLHLSLSAWVKTSNTEHYYPFLVANMHHDASLRTSGSTHKNTSKTSKTEKLVNWAKCRETFLHTWACYKTEMGTKRLHLWEVQQSYIPA